MIEEVDRISRLPDALIHNILSFIDTKYAVQTSVLSKRWIHIWKSLPFLDFDIDCYTGVATQSDRSTKSDYYTRVKQSDRFTNFIDRVFQNRDDDCSIQRFRWRGVKRKVFRSFNVSVERNVQEVTIEVLCDGSTTLYQVPPRLLNCKSLKKLTLRQRSFQSIILPISVSLPQLKVMCLDGILVSEVESIKNLFSSCPLLETLNIVNCDIHTNNPWNLTIESLSLKQFAYTSQSNEYRKHHFRPKNIQLSAPNLTRFMCTSYLTHDYNLQNSSDHLSYANLNVLYTSTYDQKQEVSAKRVVKLLLAVHKVKRLDLSSAFLEALWKATDSFSCHPLSWLCNLQSLKLLEISFTTDSLRAIAYLLSISPNVKDLILTSKKSGFGKVGDGWDVGFSSPGLLSHLNVVRIEDAEGCDSELKILSILTKNATVLEEVDVIFRFSVGCSII